ncbi:MAG: hypothetical protein J3K34DRAFT_524937 [Monoraphidium minutum]|nr:MAG: hypothetical protein J3K34DRAFT_524937 [Monoraphidium minutum]
MMLRFLAFTALVAVATANCPLQTGESALVGTQCGAAVDHTTARAGWITKINVYDDGKCIVGIKPTYGYNGKDAQILGKQVGRGSDIKLYPASGEFVIKADVTAGSCMECVTMHTNKGRSFSAGTCGSGSKATVSAPAGTHLFAFKGFFGADCAAPAISMVWGKDGPCEEPAAPAAEEPAAEEPAAEEPAVAVEEPAAEAVVEAPAAEEPAAEEPAAEAVVEAPTEAEGEGETPAAPAAVETPAAPAAAECVPAVYFYGSNGLACDAKTSKVVATGVFAKFSPFLMFDCKDLGECTDAKPAGTDEAYAKCKWAVCKPAKKQIPAIPNVQIPTVQIPTIAMPDMSSMMAKIPAMPTIQIPTITKPTIQIPTITKPTFEMPKMPEMPKIQIPTISIPTITKPTFEMPKMPEMPKMQIPTISIPTIAKPTFEMPKMPEMPTIQIPTISIPTIQKPDVSGMLTQKMGMFTKTGASATATAAAAAAPAAEVAAETVAAEEAPAAEAVVEVEVAAEEMPAEEMVEEVVEEMAAP